MKLKIRNRTLATGRKWLIRTVSDVTSVGLSGWEKRGDGGRGVGGQKQAKSAQIFELILLPKYANIA